MQNIAALLEATHERITAAAQRAQRDPAEITLVAVSKGQSVEAIRQAAAAGVQYIGENRVQEAEEKATLLQHEPLPLTWHLIGHLQRNKAAPAVRLFDMVQSLDSVRLARTLNQQRAKRLDNGDAPHDAPPGAPLPVLLQVNVSGEASKEGFDLPGGVENHALLPRLFEEVELILGLPWLRVQGLMTIAPLSADPQAARPVFRNLRLLRDTLAQRFPRATWHHLSMGMSNDFEVAIEERATIVRIGRAIFGERLHKT